MTVHCSLNEKIGHGECKALRIFINRAVRSVLDYAILLPFSVF